MVVLTGKQRAPPKATVRCVPYIEVEQSYRLSEQTGVIDLDV